MNNTPIKVALIGSATAIVIAIIVMYPTYKCMSQLNADGHDAGFMCITGK